MYFLLWNLIFKFPAMPKIRGAKSKWKKNVLFLSFIPLVNGCHLSIICVPQNQGSALRIVSLLYACINIDKFFISSATESAII